MKSKLPSLLLKIHICAVSLPARSCNEFCKKWEVHRQALQWRDCQLRIFLKIKSGKAVPRRVFWICATKSFLPSRAAWSRSWKSFGLEDITTTNLTCG